MDGAALTVSVNVGTKKGAKAVLNAMKAEGATYSQARRMSKGYYDCSSLVWRSYKPTGIVFGDRKYAPVAADEARFCVKHKKTVSKKRVQSLINYCREICFSSVERVTADIRIYTMLQYIWDRKVQAITEVRIHSEE